MSQAQVSLPVFLEYIDTDLARLGHIGVEDLCKKVACTDNALLFGSNVDQCRRFDA